STIAARVVGRSVHLVPSSSTAASCQQASLLSGADWPRHEEFLRTRGCPRVGGQNEFGGRRRNCPRKFCLPLRRVLLDAFYGGCKRKVLLPPTIFGSFND